jgi:hypothetical protein
MRIRTMRTAETMAGTGRAHLKRRPRFLGPPIFFCLGMEGLASPAVTVQRRETNSPSTFEIR